MHERRLPPLGYQCCDPRGGYEGCCGLFIKIDAQTSAQATRSDSVVAEGVTAGETALRDEIGQPCGQCAHLMKTVEELQRQLRIEEDTANKSVMRYIRQNASLDELKRDNLNLREQLNAVLVLVSEAENMHPTDPTQLQLLQEICRAVREANNIGNDAQTSSALTRTSESGQKGVTAGETALRCGGSGFVSTQDVIGPPIGEFCPGCKDCEPSGREGCHGLEGSPERQSRGVTLPVGEKPALDLVVALDKLVSPLATGERALAAYKRARTAWYEMPVRDDNADDVLHMHTAMEEALDELIASARRGEIGGWVQDPNVMTHAVCRHGVTKGDHCPDCEAMKA